MVQKLIYFITLPFRIIAALVVFLPRILIKMLSQKPSVDSAKTMRDQELLVINIKNTKLPSGKYILEDIPIDTIEDAIINKLPETAELDGHGSDGDELDIFIYGDSAEEILKEIIPILRKFHFKEVKADITRKDNSNYRRQLRL